MFENVSRKLFILHQNTVILKWFSSLCPSFHFRFETKVCSIWRNQRSCRQIYYDQYRCKYTQLYNEYLLMRVQKCLKNILQSSLFFFRMMKLWKKVKNIKLMVNITRKYFSLVSYSSSLPFYQFCFNEHLSEHSSPFEIGNPSISMQILYWLARKKAEINYLKGTNFHIFGC